MLIINFKGNSSIYYVLFLFKSTLQFCYLGSLPLSSVEPGGNIDIEIWQIGKGNRIYEGL